MKIILNNRPEEFDKNSLSVAELINEKNFTFKLLVTKINGKLVKKNERDSALIYDGDRVEVIHLVSGG
mgnify:CR=1 FL=1